MSDFNLLGTSPQSFIAGGAVGQYRAMKLDPSAGNKALVTTAITEDVIGASMISGVAGDLIPVQQFGKAKLTAGAAIAIGAQVMPLAGGAGKVVTSAGPTSKSCGIALSAAGADGDIVEVQLAAPVVNGPANT